MYFTVMLCKCIPGEKMHNIGVLIQGTLQPNAFPTPFISFFKWQAGSTQARMPIPRHHALNSGVTFPAVQNSK